MIEPRLYFIRAYISKTWKHSQFVIWNYFNNPTLLADEVFNVCKTCLYKLSANVMNIYTVLKQFRAPQKVSRDTYIITYFIGMSRYKFFSKARRGPSDYTFYDTSDCDITEIVGEFAGPGKNFHGQVVTPRMIGFDTIELRVGDSRRVFSNDEALTTIIN